MLCLKWKYVKIKKKKVRRKYDYKKNVIINLKDSISFRSTKKKLSFYLNFIIVMRWDVIMVRLLLL